MESTIDEKEKTRKLRSEMLKFAVPSMLEELFTTFTTIIDSKMVSALGITYISAVSVTLQPRNFIFAPFIAITNVLSSLISYYLGKNDRKKANSIFLTIMLIVTILSIVLGLGSWLLATPIMNICSGQKDTLSLSVQYFSIIMGAMIFNQLFLTINAGFRGYGKNNIAFWSNLISCVVNIVFNYLLIEGHFGFPAWGIVGAAVATVLGTIAAFIFDLLFLFKTREFISLTYSIKNKVKASYESLKEVLNLWKETIVEIILTRFGSLFSSAVTARIGSFETSVYSVTNYILNINFALGKGLMCAAVVLIGRSRGENSKERVKEYTKVLLRTCLVVAVITAAVVVIFAKPYVMFYSHDENFVRLGVIACIFMSIVSLAQIPKTTYVGLLQGYGAMKETKKAAMISVFILQPVVNFILVIWLKLGMIGVLISLTLSQVTWLATTWYYHKKVSKRELEDKEL